MKKLLKTGKKTLSVIMAIMMVLTAWVWVAPTEASAATAGTYDVKVRVKTTNSVDVGDNKDLTLTLDYKSNNGSGSAGTPLTHNVSYTWAENDNADNSYTFENVGGYPTKLNIDVLFATTVAVTRQWDCTIYIYIYNENTKAWDLAQETSLSKNGGGWGQTDMDFTVSSIGGTPTATSVKFLSGEEAITIPKTGGSNVTKTYTAGVYDQYGVRMTYEPTYYVRSTAPTSAQSSSSTITGVSMSSGTSSGTLTVTSGAQNTSADTKNVYVHAKYGSVYANKTVTLTDPSYTFTYNKNTTDSATISPSSNTSKQYYNTFGDASISGTRTGFTFVGFYTSQFADSYESAEYSGTKLSSTTRYTADTNWYAAWQANKHKLTFNYKDENYTDKIYIVDEYYGRTYDMPTYPEVIEIKDNGITNYKYEFNGWKVGNSIVTPPSTMPDEDVTYLADYKETTYYADLTALENAIADAKAKQETDLYKENAYTETTVAAFEDTLALAESTVNRNPLLSEQEYVNALAQSLNNANENLDIKNYTVIFTDEDGTILKDGYFFVPHGSTVTIPQVPAKSPDETNHYAFDCWDYEESDRIEECNYVTDNLIYVAAFAATPHSFTETTVSSTCTADGVITKTCDCGYSYTAADPADLASHKWSTDYKELVPATCATVGSEAKYCTACGAIDESTKREITKLGHAFGEYTEYTPATCFGKGAEVATCSRCEAKDVKEIAQKSHTYGEAETVEKTCTTDGYTKETCTLCGFINIRDIENATGHNTSVSKTNATCVSIGYEKTTCADCDYEKTDIIPATGAHNFEDNWTEVAPASCVGHGVEKRVCTVCKSATETRLTALAPHTSPAEWTVEVPATCDSEGRQVKNCTVCGKELEAETIVQLGHNYEAYADGSYAATCTTAGATAEKCSRCGDVNITVLQPLTHDWDDGTTTEATCTSGAYITYTCKRENCGETKVKVIDGSQANAHNFDESIAENVTTTAATCVSDGSKTVKCANCNETKTTILPKLGHTWGEWEVTVEATNTTDGEMKRTCSNKTCTETVKIPAGGHKWDNGTVTKPASCKEAGTMVYDCTAHTGDNDCGITLEVTVPVLQHTVAQRITEATCTKTGSVEAYCSVCDTSFESTTIPVKAHSYTAGTPQAPTCTTSGYTPYTCACGDTYNVYDASKPATGHTLVEGASTATCTKAGTKTLSCSVCKNYSVSVNVPALGHNYIEDTSAASKATCATPATKTYNCSLCSDSYIEYTGDKLTDDSAHTWSVWTVVNATDTSLGYKTRTCNICEQVEFEIIQATGEHVLEEASSKEATCTEKGMIYYKCKTHDACGVTDEVEIPATGHTEAFAYKAATCGEAGYAKMYCSVESCNAVLKSETIPALGHLYGEGKVTNANCTTEGKIEYTCTRTDCNATKTTTIARDFLAHDYITIITQPSCKAEGSIVVKCSRQGCISEAAKEMLAKLDHTWDASETTDATCVADGKTVYTCTVTGCGATKEEAIAKLGHDWGEWAVSKASTNTEEGEMKRSCKRDDCTASETHEIPAGGHNLVVTSKTNATCTAEGSVTYTCDTAHEGGVACGITVTVTLDKLQHELETSKTDATCEADGEVITKCKNCDTTTITTTIPATGHTYNDGVKTDATCTSTGKIVYTCTAKGCGATKEVTLDKLQHVYTADGEATAPTCTSSGYTTYKCSNKACDSKFIVLGAAATGHSFDETVAENVTVDAATCTKDGTKTVKCKACDVKNTVVIPKTGHNYIKGTVVAADCTTAGTVDYECEYCKDSYTEFTAPASGHTYGNWEVVTAATADKNGVQKRTCACGDVEYGLIAPIGNHTFTEKVETAATCTTEGLKSFTCSAHTNCSANYTETIPAKGHTETLVYTPADCDTPGETKIVCDTCKNTIGTETEIPALGHLFNGTGDYTPATCVARGSMTYTCTRQGCTETHTTTIATNSDAHDFDRAETPASCKAEGTVTVTCKNEGCTLEEITTLPKLQHSWGQWSIATPATNSTGGVMKRLCANGCEETCTIPAGEHEFDTSNPASTTSATCEEEGTATYNCTAHANCGVTITVNTGYAEHTYAMKKVESCSTNGSVITYCTVCEKELSRIDLGKAQHEFEVISITEATCIKSGYKTYKCKNCNETYNEINGNAKGHTLKEGSSTATCLAGGKMTLSCACGYETTVDVPALGHDYTLTASSKATCAAAATETYTCSRVGCVASYTVSVDDKLTDYDAHNWSGWTVVKAATENSIGYQTRECQACHKLEVQTIEATGEHQFENGAVVEGTRVEPTCTANGSEERMCSVHTGDNTCGKTAVITILATGHTEKTIDAVAATCTTAGSSAGSECSVCGTTLVEPVELPMLGHNWGEEEVTPATCKSAGKIDYTCTRENCGATHTVAIEIDGDAHKYTTTTTQATCRQDGSVVTECSLCGDTTTVTIPATGHTFTGAETTVKTATCTVDGSKTVKCVNCDATDIVTIPKLGHNMKAGEAVKPTCTTSGYTPYSCENGCGESYKVYDATVVEHNYVKVEGSLTASCTDAGTITMKCSECDDEITAEVPALGHSYGNWVTTNPTAATEGSKVRECSICHTTETVPLPKLGHEMVKDDDASTQATCTAEGTDVYVCTTHTGDNACGYTYSVKVALKAHTYDETIESNVTIVDADCENNGSKTVKCKDCDSKITSVIPGTGHTMSTTVTEASCKAEGSVVTKCTVDGCDYKLEDKILAIKPHTISVTYAYPSCSIDGYVKEECDKCDYEKLLSTTAALGHSYTVDVEVTKAATCLRKGEKTVKCSRCDATTTVEIPATGHNYVAGNEVKATCTESGYIPYACDNKDCTSSYKELTANPNGHTWNTEAESETKATCEVDGKATYKCQFCEATNEVITPKFGHSWTEWTITKAPTATEEGENTRTCLRGCKETVSIPALGSATTYKVDFVVDGEIIFTQTVNHLGAATAPEVANKAPDANYHYSFNWDTDFSAVTSDLTVTAVFTPVSHTYGEWITDKTADCSNDGLRHRVCACGFVDEEVVGKLSHDFSEIKEEKAPTCTENGYRVVVCKNCGTNETRSLNRLGHSMTLYEGYKATCDTDGVARHYNCSRCGKDFEDREGKTELITVVIIKKYHTYVVVEGTDATCTDEGNTDYRYCTSCGYTQHSETIPAYGHSDSNGDDRCDRCGILYENNGALVCTCNCHKKGMINEIFYKILLFFWRLFGISKSCECGTVHY